MLEIDVIFRAFVAGALFGIVAGMFIEVGSQLVKSCLKLVIILWRKKNGNV